MTMKVLYISYDGAADNLGQSQIIPYIRGLSQENIAFALLTFEKGLALCDKNLISSIKDGLNERIEWIPLKYHKRPSLIVTFYDTIHGFLIAWREVKKKNIKIVHGRSFIGSVIALFLKKTTRVKVLLDIRGFWPEERVEAGIWKRNGFLYKFTKRIERALILNADEIVTLTLNGKEEIGRSGYLKDKEININVIPTCVDINNTATNRTNDKLFNSLGLDNKFVISYIGSVSTWYMPVEIFNFFDVAQKLINNSSLFILTKEDKFLEDILNRRGKIRKNISILNVEHKLVSQYLSLARFGLAFYKPGYSRKACCPTKFGEYLACGLPVVINRGIGDCDEIISKEKVGVIINEFSAQEYEKAIIESGKLLSEGNDLKDRCRSVAKRYFSLDKGVESYLRIYNRLSEDTIKS